MTSVRRKAIRREAFDGFWIDYLHRHSDRTCRRWHDAGLATAAAILALAWALKAPWLILVAIVVSYGAAWFGHLVVSSNRPASFEHPWWSLWANVRWLFLRAVAPRL